MSRHMTLATYLSGEETTLPRELAYGVLREAAAPTFDHQIVVGRTYARLDLHVRRHRAGRVVCSPIDVVLDRAEHLVVQPDVVFVAAERMGICVDRIWGAPDLVVEVLSMGNSRHDRTVKVDWYQRYGVRECWLIDLVSRTVEVLDLTVPIRISRTFENQERVCSAVLPRLRLRPADVFDD